MNVLSPSKKLHAPDYVILCFAGMLCSYDTGKTLMVGIYSQRSRLHLLKSHIRPFMSELY